MTILTSYPTSYTTDEAASSWRGGRYIYQRTTGCCLLGDMLGSVSRITSVHVLVHHSSERIWPWYSSSAETLTYPNHWRAFSAMRGRDRAGIYSHARSASYVGV
jgi:hypothetical protein